MRILLLFLVATTVCAQEQERKLVDRLLKPDMTLQSNSQQKTFQTTREARAQQINARAFYLSEKNLVKNFSDNRQFATTSFQTTKIDPKVANLPKNAVPTRQLADVRAVAGKTASDSGKQTNGHDFAGNRPFLVEGKRQKELNTKNKPLTIDEVRELLNKNK